MFSKIILPHHFQRIGRALFIPVAALGVMALSINKLTKNVTMTSHFFYSLEFLPFVIINVLSISVLFIILVRYRMFVQSTYIRLT